MQAMEGGWLQGVLDKSCRWGRRSKVDRMIREAGGDNGGRGEKMG